MNAKYNFGGISKFLGVFKVRVGQGDMATRIKSMHKKGHTDIDMVEFDKKMTKAEICQVLIKHERFQKFTKEIQEIQETLDKKTGLVVAKKTSPAKPAVVKQEKVAKEKPKKTVSAKKPKLIIQKPAPIIDEDDLEIEELKKLAV